MLGSARVAPRRDRECTWLRRLPHVCAQSLQAECGVRGQLVLLAVATRSDDFAAVASRRVSLSRAVGCSVRQVARGSPSQRAERESLLSAVQEVGRSRPCADFARGAPLNEVEWVPWGASVSGVNCRLYLNVLTVTHFRFRSHYDLKNIVSTRTSLHTLLHTLFPRSPRTPCVRPQNAGERVPAVSTCHHRLRARATRSA